MRQQGRERNVVSRTLEDSLRWTAHGTKLLDAIVVDLSDRTLREPTDLPGWSRAHLVAHLNGNADALLNLVRWASSGVPTPMYASADARSAEIDRGSRLTARELLQWFASSTTAFERACNALSVEAWSREVVTAQGRTVPATEIPWLRAREVMVHAVDLTAGRADAVGFGDLPPDFLAALADDIMARRQLFAVPDRPQPEVVAWLAGRPHRLASAPELPAWL